MLEWILMKILGLVYLGGVLTITGCMGIAGYMIYLHLSGSWLPLYLQVPLLLGAAVTGLVISFIALKKGVEFMRLD